MNTNNKEALKENVEMRLAWLTHTMKPQETEMLINCVLNMIQDNEDTEVEDIAVQENTCLCKEDNCPNCEYVGCKHVKPSSKVEKLKAIKNEVVYTSELHVIKDSLINLLNLLIEDEE